MYMSEGVSMHIKQKLKFPKYKHIKEILNKKKERKKERLYGDRTGERK